MNVRKDERVEQPAAPDRRDADLDGALTNEDAALALLRNAQVSSDALSQLARSSVTAKSRKVLLGVVEHPRTPRHLCIPLLRRMFTFDLVQVTLTPTVAADIKRAAEEQIKVRLESVPTGERITLARRVSGRIAAELLQDRDARVTTPALDNSQLTEALVVQALMKKDAPAGLFRLVSEHPKWSLRREVQIALLRSENTPPDRVQELARNFSADFLREILPEHT
ncbi:MAG TPA: hypothetical protein VFA85_18330 [Terriglobales bacterium]|nr:hypothetical protein [Terriglobales bacterium]